MYDFMPLSDEAKRLERVRRGQRRMVRPFGSGGDVFREATLFGASRKKTGRWLYNGPAIQGGF
jgi:hypothetical protein